MLQVNHVTTKENKNERFTGLSPGYQIVSLFGSFQTHTHAKWEIHRSVALTFGAKPWKLQKFSTVSLLSLSTIFSVKSTAKWVTKKCSEWLCFLCPVQCTFLFVWDKNHYMPQQTAKNKIITPLKETSFWAQCGAEPHGGHFDWLALRWQGACRRTRLTLLKDDSTMQRKEWALHSKSSVIGEHQSVCVSTKSTAVPTLFPAAPTHDGFPVHICGTFLMSALPSAVLSSPIYGQRAGWIAPSSGHGWLKQQWDKAAI